MIASSEEPAIFHFELVLKVHPRRDVTGLFVSSPIRRSVRSRRKRTLLSFQRPALLATKKSLQLAPEAQWMLGTCVVSDCVLWALQCRGKGTVSRGPIGQPGNDSSVEGLVKRRESA